jgi:hypothetical protein
MPASSQPRRWVFQLFTMPRLLFFHKFVTVIPGWYPSGITIEKRKWCIGFFKLCNGLGCRHYQNEAHLRSASPCMSPYCSNACGLRRYPGLKFFGLPHQANPNFLTGTYLPTYLPNYLPHWAQWAVHPACSINTWVSKCTRVVNPFLWFLSLFLNWLHLQSSCRRSALEEGLGWLTEQLCWSGGAGGGLLLQPASIA